MNWTLVDLIQISRLEFFFIGRDFGTLEKGLFIGMIYWSLNGLDSRSLG